MNVAKKYEELVKNVVHDADIDSIDFPLIASKFKTETLAAQLDKKLVEKLGGLQDDDELQLAAIDKIFSSPPK